MKQKYFENWKQCREYLWMDAFRYVGEWGGGKATGYYSHVYSTSRISICGVAAFGTIYDW